jgi:hypothetical protein
MDPRVTPRVKPEDDDREEIAPIANIRPRRYPVFSAEFLPSVILGLDPRIPSR